MEINDTVIVPVIMSVVELAKRLGMPRKFSAVLAVIVGAFMGIFFEESHNFRVGLFKGIVYGLAASGLYSGTKNTYQQVKENRDKSCKG